MDDSPGDQQCSGVHVTDLIPAADDSLVLVLADPIRCPTCGGEFRHWVVPATASSGDQTMRHRLGDPGE
jgi:phosphatidylethanolamine-binding protein (PEBP) family uncharacterized protein